MDFTLEFDGGSGSLIAYDEAKVILGYMVIVSIHDEGWIVEHTIVEEHGQGKGTGKALLRQLLHLAAQADVYIVPECPFVFGQFQKYPEEAVGRAIRKSLAHSDL